MSETTLEVIKPEEFGLDQKKAKSIDGAFAPKEKELTALATQYNEVLSLELNKEAFAKARKLRLDLVKFRGSVNEIHKVEKAYYLAGGRYVDAQKNRIVTHIQQWEEKLNEIEKYEENLEKERKDKLVLERKAELDKYGQDSTFLPLGEMSEDQYKGMLELSKAAYNKRIEDDKKAKEEEEQRLLEEERLNKRELERSDKLKHLYSFVNLHAIDLRNMSDESFLDVVKKAEADKEAYEAEQAEIKAENERLKKEAEEREKMHTERANLVQPYLSIIKDYNALINKPQDEFEKDLSSLKKEAEENKKKEAEEKEKERVAEEKRKADEAERERLKKIADEVEAKRKEEEARVKALENADDQIKFKAFFKELEAIKIPKLKNGSVSTDIASEMARLRVFLIDQSKKLL